MYMPSWTLTEPSKCSAHPPDCEATIGSKKPPTPWSCTTKPEFICEICVSELGSEQEFTETLKSLSAITGIFLNHYRSSEAARTVLKLIHTLVLSILHMIASDTGPLIPAGLFNLLIRSLAVAIDETKESSGAVIKQHFWWFYRLMVCKHVNIMTSIHTSSD